MKLLTPSGLLFVALTSMMSLTLVTPSFAQDGEEAKSSDAIPKYEDLTPERQSEVASLLELAKNNESRGDYVKALEHYKDAHKLFAHPKLLFSIASMYERNADKRNARIYYQRYVDALPEGPQAQIARKRLTQLTQVPTVVVTKQTSLRVESNPPGATVYLNDIVNGPSGTTPTTDLPVNAGTYTIIMRLDGYEESTQEVVVDAGERASITSTLKKKPDLNPKPKASSGSATPWVLMGIGTTGLIVGGAFLYMAEDTTYEEDYETYNTIGLVSLGVGVLSLTGALIYFVTQDDGVALSIPTGTDTNATVSWPSVWMGQDSGGLSVQGRF